jgi:poly-gamma-glutamate synthesis protein (capsule biosynthesis protein)
MTVLLMTGVTALTRGTAIAMEREGVTYPAQDIRDWLLEADLTHVSNEVSFAENCPPPAGYTTLVFCSDPRYIELLEAMDIDAVELTGNHLLDWGVEAMRNSLRMYEERNMPYYGGGWTLSQARNPLILKHGEHTFGFLGCNPVGPSSVWATDERLAITICSSPRFVSCASRISSLSSPSSTGSSASTSRPCSSRSTSARRRRRAR